MRAFEGCTNGPTNPCSLLFETVYGKGPQFQDNHAGVLGSDACYLGPF